MKRSREIIELPVVSISDGVQIGTVKGLFINPQQKNVEFLLLDDKGVSEELRGIPYLAAEAVGEFAVTVQNSHGIIDILKVGLLKNLVDMDINVIGTKVITKKGMYLGDVTEYSMELDKGNLKYFYFKMNGDKGEKIIAVENVITIGKEALIIEDNYQEPLPDKEDFTKSFKEGDEKSDQATYQEDRDPVIKDEPETAVTATVIKPEPEEHVIEESQATGKPPASEEEQEVEEPLLTEEDPVVEESPAAEELPVADEDTAPEPAAFEEPAAAEVQPEPEPEPPVFEEPPVMEEPPASEEEQEVEEPLLTEEDPVAEELPAAEEAPVTEEESVTEELPVADEGTAPEPAAFEESAAAEEPEPKTETLADKLKLKTRRLSEIISQYEKEGKFARQEQAKAEQVTNEAITGEETTEIEEQAEQAEPEEITETEVVAEKDGVEEQEETVQEEQKEVEKSTVSKLVEQQKQYVLGKTLIRDIKTDDGEILAKENEMVTEDLFSRLYNAGPHKVVEAMTYVKD